MKNTQLSSLAIVFFLMLFSCNATGPDVSNIAKALENVDNFRMPTDGMYAGPGKYRGPWFYLDSAGEKSNSKMTIFAHLEYDSILVLKQLGINYWEDIVNAPNPVVITKLANNLPDTINFKALPDSIAGSRFRRFNVKMTIDNLKSNTDYKFCIFSNYQDKIGIIQIGVCNIYRTK